MIQFSPIGMATEFQVRNLGCYYLVLNVLGTGNLLLAQKCGEFAAEEAHGFSLLEY